MLYTSIKQSGKLRLLKQTEKPFLHTKLPSFNQPVNYICHEQNPNKSMLHLALG